MKAQWFSLAFSLALVSGALGQTTQRVVDIPTRPDVTQRLLVLTPSSPKASVVLLAGGHGGVQIYPNGSMKLGGNFLVRSRQMFADQAFTVAVLDAPSDRQRPPFLRGFRQRPEHAADIKAVIAWLRQQAKVPVWLVGTSRGTQSAAYAATQLDAADGPDGLVLTSTILRDDKEPPVQAMPLETLRIPVLVVHHEMDGCEFCPFTEIPALMGKLHDTPRSQLLTFTGGNDTGDACEAFAHHGFNGLEREVVQKIAAWITTP